MFYFNINNMKLERNGNIYFKKEKTNKQTKKNKLN